MFALLFTERNVLTVHSLRIVRNVLMVTFVDGAATTQIQVLVRVFYMVLNILSHRYLIRVDPNAGFSIFTAVLEHQGTAVIVAQENFLT